MAFTTWAALRTAIKDAIADHVDGSPCTGSYEIEGRKMTYRNFNELTRLYQKTYVLEALEDSGKPSQMVSYGRHRRFR